MLWLPLACFCLLLLALACFGCFDCLRFPLKIDAKLTKIRTKIDEKLTKIQTKSQKKAKKCPRAPKSVTKGAGPTLPQILGPSWAALGTLLGRPGRAPGRLKRSQEHQISSPKLFFAHFFASFFHVAFGIHFWSPKLCNDWYRNLKNKRFA